VVLSPPAAACFHHRETEERHMDTTKLTIDPASYRVEARG